MSRMKPATTVREIVDAFGGTGAFADWANVVPSAVSNWISLNRIPPGYHLLLVAEAHRRKLRIDAAALGLNEEVQLPRKISFVGAPDESNAA